MSSDGSITGLISGMKSGDDDAAQKIWDRYSPRLAALAKKRLPQWLHCIVSGDDVANSAMRSVIMGRGMAQFPEASRPRRSLGHPGLHNCSQSDQRGQEGQPARSAGRMERSFRSKRISSPRILRRIRARGR